MTDETNVAEAAPEAIPAAAPEPVVETDAGPAIDRAFSALGIDGDTTETTAPEAEPTPETDEPAPDDRPRGPDGKFVAKEGEAEKAAEPAKEPAETQEKDTKPAEGAPTRFSADAKEAWAKTPKSVQAEISRSVKELESGIEKYRADAEPLQEFRAIAEKSGTTLADALGRYVNTEKLLYSDPKAGFEAIARNLGTTLEAVMGKQSADQPPELMKVIQHQQQQIRELTQGVQSVRADAQARTQNDIMRQIDAFAAENPRYTELEGDIAKLLSSGYATDLSDAYLKAERLKPAPQPAPQPLAPQTSKADISINGAPVSNPARQQSATTGDAIDAAFRAVGI